MALSHIQYVSMVCRCQYRIYRLRRLMKEALFLKDNATVVVSVTDNKLTELVDYFRHLFDAGNVGVDAHNIGQPVFVLPDKAVLIDSDLIGKTAKDFKDGN